MKPISGHNLKVHPFLKGKIAMNEFLRVKPKKPKNLRGFLSITLDIYRGLNLQLTHSRRKKHATYPRRNADYPFIVDKDQLALFLS